MDNKIYVLILNFRGDLNTLAQEFNATVVDNTLCFTNMSRKEVSNLMEKKFLSYNIGNTVEEANTLNDKESIFKKRVDANDDYLSFIVVSLIVDEKDNKEKIGYVLVPEHCASAKYIQLDKLRDICEQVDVKFLNAYYDMDKKDLVCTMGDWNDYGKVTMKYTIVKNSIAVYYILQDKNTLDDIGCICFNALGTRYTITNQKLVTLSGKYPCANFDIDINNGVKIVPKSDVVIDFPKVRMLDTIKSSAYRSKEGDESTYKPAETATSLPSVLATDFSKVEESEFNLDASFKLANAKKNLGKLAPYYHSLYEAIKIKAKPGLGTMGVTEDTLYYDMEFVASKSVSELTFILIHEISHIVMKHSIRLRNRDAELWNIATDLYINELICNDYKINFGSEEIVTESGATIQAPKDGVFLSTINESLDFSKDTPELIYDRLSKDETDILETSEIIPPTEKSKAKLDSSGGSGGGQQPKQKLATIISSILATIDKNVDAIKKNSDEIESNDYAFGRQLVDSGLNNLNLPQIIDGAQQMLDNHTNLTTCESNLEKKSVFHNEILKEYDKLLRKNDSDTNKALDDLSDSLVEQFDEDKATIISKIEETLKDIKDSLKLLNICKKYNKMVFGNKELKDNQEALEQNLKDFYDFVSNVNFNCSTNGGSGGVPEDHWDVEYPPMQSQNQNNNNNNQDSQGGQDSQDSQDGQSSKGGQDSQGGQNQNNNNNGQGNPEGSNQGGSSGNSGDPDDDYRDYIGKGGHQERPENSNQGSQDSSNNGQNNQKGNQGSQDSLDNGQSGSDGGQNSQNGSQDGQNNQSGSQEGQNNQGSQNGNQSSQGSQGNSQNGSDGVDKHNDSNFGSNEKIDPFSDATERISKNKGDLDSKDNIAQQQTKQVSVTYKGKKLTGKMMMDVMSNQKGETAQKENMEKREEESKDALQRIDTKVKMDNAKLSSEGDSNGYGSGFANLLARYVKFGLSADIDWRRIFRKLAKENPKSGFSLATPNRNYMSRGMTLAGEVPLHTPKDIGKIKICIDVSGSVSDVKLAYFLGEVSNIFSKFKASGELIYWSTEVGDAGEFHDKKGLLKVNPDSTGGTDVKCLFEYLNGETPTATGKMCKTKPNSIKAVVIITDGEFSKNYGKYAKQFGSKTIWIIDGNIFGFDPMFGKVYGLNNKEED